MPPDLSAHELGALLGDGRVASFERRPHPYGTSHALEELDVHLVDGSSLTLLAKDTATRSSEANALRLDHERAVDEADVYRSVVAPHELAAPRFYGSVGTVLVLELVRGRPLWQVGELELWQSAAARLAVVHEQTRRIELELPWHESGAGARRRAARARLDEPGWFDRAWLRAAHVLEQLPAVLVHGDCYPSNVLVRADGRIVFVDWEEASVGAGVIDLAALTAGWDDRAAAAIVAAYVDASPAARSLGDQRFREALAAARFLEAVRWLATPASWRPPAEHANDWSAQARAAAGALT